MPPASGSVRRRRTGLRGLEVSILWRDLNRSGAQDLCFLGLELRVG